MRVKEVMTKAVHTLPPDRSLPEARTIMKEFGIDHVIVVEHGKPVGVLSDGDIMRNANAPTVGAAMSRNLVSIHEDELISRAANLMRGHSIKCLVVTHESKLAGVVTSTDLLEVVGRAGHPERMTLRDRGARKRRSNI